MVQRVRGVVVWFNANKGFGFVKTEKIDTVFIHHSNIIPTREGEFMTLENGEQVEFKLIDAPSGYAAKDLVRLSHAYD